MCRRWLTPSQIIASVSSAVAAVACLSVRCRVCLQAPQTHVSAMVQPQVARGSHLSCQERCWLRLRLRSRNACAGDG